MGPQASSEKRNCAALTALVDRVELRRDGLRLSLKLPLPAAESRDEEPRADTIITRFFPMRVRRRGVELRLVIQDQRTHAPRVDLVLLKAVARGRRWFEELAAGRAASIPEIAQREGVNVRYVVRTLSFRTEVIDQELDGMYRGGGENWRVPREFAAQLCLKGFDANDRSLSRSKQIEP